MKLLSSEETLKAIQGSRTPKTPFKIAEGTADWVVEDLKKIKAAKVEAAAPATSASAPVDPIPAFPAELKTLNAWGVYRIEERTKDGETIKVKVPYNAQTGAQGNPFTARSACSFAEACAALEASRSTDNPYHGLAFGFIYENGYTGGDIDDCRDKETGIIEPWAMEIIKEANTYTEVSVSGTGLHFVAKGWQIPWDGTPEGKQGRRCGIEMYSGKHYFTVSGNHLDETPSTVESRDLAGIFKKLEDRVYEKRANQAFDSEVVKESSENYSSAALVYGGKSITTKRTLLMTGTFTEGAKPFRVQDEWDNYVDYPSHSEASMALLQLIACEVTRDAGGIDAEFRKSVLYREEKDERDVLSQHTIEAAIKSATDADSKKAPAATVVADEIPEDPTAMWEPDLTQDFEITYAQTSMRDLTIRLYGQSVVYAVTGEKGVWMRFNGKSWVEVGPSVIRDLVRKASYYIRDKMIPALTGKPEDVQATAKRFRTLISQCHDVTFTNKVMTWMMAKQIDCRDFDQQGMLVNFLNGTYDVNTREFRKFEPKDLLTQVMSVKYNPSAKCPVFRQMLKNAFDNPQMRDFIVRYMGYCMLGIATEKCFVMLHGDGDNGKTILLETLASILGSYAVACDWDTFSQSREGTIRNDIAGMCNARFVYCDEGDKEMKVAASKVKAMSGDGSLRARFLNKEYFTFPIKFKMILSTNTVPKLPLGDGALIGRILDVHMKKSFKEGDPLRMPNLKARLWSEREGIAALMVEGALDFLKGGLKPPDEVKANREASIADQTAAAAIVLDRKEGSHVVVS